MKKQVNLKTKHLILIVLFSVIFIIFALLNAEKDWAVFPLITGGGGILRFSAECIKRHKKRKDALEALKAITKEAGQ